MSLDFSPVTNNVRSCCEDNNVFFFQGLNFHHHPKILLSFTFVHLAPARLSPAATGWHVGLAWWSAGFFFFGGGGLQSGSTAGSRHLPLLHCTPALRFMRAHREHGGVRENTNRAPIVPDLGSTPPQRPHLQGFKTERMSNCQWCFVNT